MNFEKFKERTREKEGRGEIFQRRTSQPDGKKDKMQCVVPIGMRCTPGFSASSLIRQLFSLKRSMSTQLKLTFHRNKGSPTRERERERGGRGKEGGREDAPGSLKISLHRDADDAAVSKIWKKKVELLPQRKSYFQLVNRVIEEPFERRVLALPTSRLIRFN